MTSNDVKIAADGAAAASGIAAFMQWLPPMVGTVSGLLTIVWLGIRIWETDTVKSFFNRDKDAQ